MRESKIESYDPGYRSPLYPWMQIFGIVASFWLLAQMGIWTRLLTGVMVFLGVAWYYYYVKQKVMRAEPYITCLNNWDIQDIEGLDRELRGILKRKNLEKRSVR